MPRTARASVGGIALNLWRVALVFLLLVPVHRAVSTADDGGNSTNEIKILVDAAHPWRPPFGLDRVGRPLTVEVESRAKIGPPQDFALAAYRDGKVVARHEVDFSNSAPFIGRVTFAHWPEEIAPFRDRHQWVTPVYWGNHWPLARGAPTGQGINDAVHKTPAHNSIMTWGFHLRPEPLESQMVNTEDTLGKKRPMHVQKFAWLIGMTDDSDARLLERVRSYARPPAISVTGGLYGGWKADLCAHLITVAESTVLIRIKPRVPCVNPVFHLAGAGGKLSAVILDGGLLRRQDYAWDGRTLWLDIDITRPAALQLTFENP